MRRIKIFDTTLRDGEQSPGASMNADEKLVIARQLERLGVDVIEAGFPICSAGDFESVRLIAENIMGPRSAGLRALASRTSTRPARLWSRARTSASTCSSPPPSCTWRRSSG